MRGAGEWEMDRWISDEEPTLTLYEYQSLGYPMLVLDLTP